MTTPTIRAALEWLVDLSKQHAIASVWDGAFFNARAALAAAASGDGLAPRVLAMCKQRNWSLHWTSRGAYLHLEASELIEALRGKRGDPLAEAADVLLVLMSITENAGIDWSAVVQQTAATCSRLEACDQYPGEDRMDSLTALKAKPVGEGPSERIVSIAKAVQECAFAHESDARLIGNVCAEDVADLCDAVIDRWGRPATPPAPETPAEALAARPLLEQVARLGDCIGANTVGQIMAISSRAAAWLEENPPGQPVAIEPRGCPTPGACSCVETAAPAAPEPGEVGELVDRLGWIAAQLGNFGWSDDSDCVARAATLLQQQAAPAPAAVPVAVAERLPGEGDYHPELAWCWGYRYGRWTMMEQSCFAPPKEHIEATYWCHYSDIPLPQIGEGEA